MRTRTTDPAVLLLALVASACSQGDAPRPDSKESTILIEGQTERITLERFRPADSFPLRFETYIPADMTADTVDTGRGEVVRIRAAFGGEPVSGAAVHIATLPPGTDAAEAGMWASSLADGVARDELYQEDDPAWGHAIHRLEGERAGFVALDEHEGTWFYVLAAYPPEYGDGMPPRIEVILDEWRWTDETGGSLR